MVRVLFLEHQPSNLSVVKDVFLELDPELDYDVRLGSTYLLDSVEIVVYDIIVFDCDILPDTSFSDHSLSLLEEKCVLVALTKDQFSTIEKLRLSNYKIDNYLFRDLSQLLRLSVKRELELFTQRDEIEGRKHTEHLLNAITDITSSLLEIQNLDEIARLVIDRIVEHFHFEDCIIYQVNQGGKSLTQVAAKGPKEDFAYYVKDPLTLQVGEGIVGTVAKTGMSINLGDVRKDKRYIVDDARRNSELTVPIILNGEVIGVIDSESHDLNFYTERDLQNLEAVASVIAIKFHAAQLRSEKEDVQKELQKSLDEKIVLLSEVHHRVKNNLAIISGLLHLQSNDKNHPELVEIMLEMSNRIQSIAGVHELLYNSESFADITFDDYLKNLFTTISSTFQQLNSVSLELEIDNDLRININQAVPLGLILNELVTNSFKYAFNDVVGPQIKFSLHLVDGIVYGAYSDNGDGFSPNLLENPKSLGFTVITALFSQLDSSISYNPVKTFPLEFNFEHQTESFL